MEIATIVLLVFNIIFGLCLGLGFLWGLKRGVKKSAVRIASIAISIALAFIVAMPVTNTIMTMDISSLNMQTSSGAVATSFSEFITDAISSNPEIKEAYDNSESLQALVEALPKMLIQCIVFVILFWVFKMISWIVYAIIAKCIWGKKKEKKAEKKAKKETKKQENRTVANGQVIENGNVQEVKKPKPKKYRLAGAAVGTLQGLAIALFTMIPFAGVSSILTEIDSTATKVSAATSMQVDTPNLKPLGDILREQLPKEALDSLTAYDKSIMGKVFGLVKIDDWLFDMQSSVKFHDDRTNLRHELFAFINAYDSLRKIESYDLSKLDFDSLQTMCDYLFDSYAVKNIADDLLPHYVNKVLNDPNASIDATIKDFLQLYVDSYNTPKIAELEKDLTSIIQAMKLIQGYDLFGILDDPNGFDANRLIAILEDDGDKTPVKDIFTSLTSSTTLQKVLQTSVNYSLDYLSKEFTKIQGADIKIAHAKFDNINWANVNTELPQVINNIFDLYKQYNISGTTEDKITNIDFENIGNTLELFSASSLLTEAYDNTMASLKQVDKYNKYIDFDSLNSQTDFAQEFTYIQNSVNALIDVDALGYFTNKSMTLEEFMQKLGTEITTMHKTCIAVITDNLTSSTILKASVPKTLNTFYQEKIEPTVDQVIDEINTININWNTEKDVLISSIEFIADNATYLLNGSNQDLIKNVDLRQLGNCFDGMRDSRLLFPLYKLSIDKMKTNASIQKIINTDFVNVDTKWQENLAPLQLALNNFKANGIIDDLFAPNGIKSVLTKIKNDKTIIEGFVNNAFDSPLMQQSVEQLVNKLQSLIGTELNIIIPNTTINVDEFIANLDTKKLEFSNIISNIAVLASPLMESSFNLDTFVDNLTAFGDAFEALQNSVEFNNTYTAIIDYLANEPSIKNVVDFGKVDADFDFPTEFAKINSIVNILKADNAWSGLVNNTTTVDEAIKTLTPQHQEEIVKMIVESKLFQGQAVQVLNEMIVEINKNLGASISPIPENTDLTTQSENISKITKCMITLNDSIVGTMQLNKINLQNLGELLNLLKYNKFDLQGNLNEIYDAFVNFMVADASYGYIIDDICDSYDEVNEPIKINTIDWATVCSAFKDLLDEEAQLNDVQNLNAQSVIDLLNRIGNNENILVEKIAKTFLKHQNMSKPSSAVDNFDFGDTAFNSQAITTLYSFNDAIDLFKSNTNNALTQIQTSLNTMSTLDNTKLNNLMAFIDFTTNTNLVEKTQGVNYSVESQTINAFKTLLNTPDISMDVLKNGITELNKSTLILNELANQNIIICDLQNTGILNSLKGGAPVENNIIINELTNYIDSNTTPSKTANVKKILNLV